MASPVRSRSWWLAGALAGALVAGCGSTAAPTQSPSPILPTPTVLESVAPIPSASPEPSPTPAMQVYIIRKGDTLIAIATRFHITLAALRAANPDVKDPRLLRLGQKLLIPGP